MMVRLVDAGWEWKLIDALRAGVSELRLISPFIKADALDRLLSPNTGKVQVITGSTSPTSPKGSVMPRLCGYCLMLARGFEVSANYRDY